MSAVDHRGDTRCTDHTDEAWIIPERRNRLRIARVLHKRSHDSGFIQIGLKVCRLGQIIPRNIIELRLKVMLCNTRKNTRHLRDGIIGSGR